MGIHKTEEVDLFSNFNFAILTSDKKCEREDGFLSAEGYFVVVLQYCLVSADRGGNHEERSKIWPWVVFSFIISPKLSLADLKLYILV